MSNKSLGDLGEKIAEEFLEKKGYKILEMNYSSKLVSGPQRGEIDIVAKKDGIISFIEVKTIKANTGLSTVFLPEEKVNLQKQKRILKMAENWLLEKKIPLDSQWQIDVVSIIIDFQSKKAKIRHFPNIIF